MHFLVDFYFSTFARKFALGGSLRECNFYLCEVEVCEKVKCKKKNKPFTLTPTRVCEKGIFLAKIRKIEISTFARNISFSQKWKSVYFHFCEKVREILHLCYRGKIGFLSL